MCVRVRVMARLLMGGEAMCARVRVSVSVRVDGKSHLFYFRNLLFPNIDYTLDLV